MLLRPTPTFRSIIHLLFTGRGNARIPVAVLQTRSFRERSNLDCVKGILNKEKTNDESHSVGT